MLTDSEVSPFTSAGFVQPLGPSPSVAMYDQTRFASVRGLIAPGLAVEFTVHVHQISLKQLGYPQPA